MSPPRKAPTAPPVLTAIIIVSMVLTPLMIIIHDRLVNEFALTAKPLTLAQCAAQDREERAKWADYVKIAKIEPQ